MNKIMLSGWIYGQHSEAGRKWGYSTASNTFPLSYASKKQTESLISRRCHHSRVALTGFDGYWSVASGEL